MTKNTAAIISAVTAALILSVLIGVAGAAPNAYVTHSDGTISVTDVATNAITNTLSPGLSNPCGIALTSDGSKAYVTNYGRGTVTVLDTATGEAIGTTRVGATPYAIAITPDEKKIYVTQESSGTVSVIDTVTNSIIATVTGVGPNPYGIAITPDGKKAYVTDLNSGTAKIVDTSTETVVGTVEGIGPLPRGIAIAPDGKAYIAQQNSGTVCIVDTSTDAVVGTVTGVGPYLYGVAVTSDGKKAYVTSYNRATATVIDVSSKTVAGTIDVGSNPIGIAITQTPISDPITPVAAFTLTPISGQAPLTVNFDASPSINAASFSWKLGDGTDLGSEKIFSHNFVAQGKYDVTLTVTSADGITDAVTRSVEVTAPVVISENIPIAKFSTSVKKGYAPLSVTFTDLSANVPTSWLWNFGDGQTSAEKNPTHIYTTAGSYAVTLTAANGAGANVSAKSNIIKVLSVPAPVAKFTYGIKKKNSLNVQFTDMSRNRPTSWTWNFGDGGTSDLKNPAHTYAKAGKYTVKLTVYNNGGENTILKNIKVENKR